jgi:hypothetical protein
MPKTLAALASNQYATVLSLVSGKADAFSLFSVAADASASTLGAAAPADTVDCHLTTFVIEGWRYAVAVGTVEIAGRKVALKHGRGASRRRERRGAAVLN